MLHSLKELFQLLTRGQQRKLFRLQCFVVLMAFAEIASILSIGPFMAVVGDMQQLNEDNLLAKIYNLSKLNSPEQFLFWMGIAVLVALALAASVSTYTIWRLSVYGQQVGAELSVRLYSYYMHQPWLFHANGTSSQLTNKVSQECLRITNMVIRPALQMNAKAVLAGFMTIVLFIYNPKVALFGVAIFFFSYQILYRTVRRKLINYGNAISIAQNQRFKLMSEGFGGIKDVLLLGRQSIFVRRFTAESERYSRAQGITQALSQVPRYAIELVAFSAVIFLVLYLLRAHKGNLGEILPILSVYTLAGFKLLPAFQNIYTSVSQIRSNLAAFESIKSDLRSSQNFLRTICQKETGPIPQKLVPKNEIKVRDVSFTYPNKKNPALHLINISIPARKTIGLVGPSGSGKSTLIDVLLGLVDPQKGCILIDGKPLNKDNVRAWQNSLGFVSQTIFLADTTIRENIAFGLPMGLIDENRVQQAASLAHLDELITQLPEGLSTTVGERGIQLSGGQRQRIGIARALYHDAEVLVLDEATSALDGITEKLVLDAINDFGGLKTIIMIAHRLTTVKECDIIYFLQHGQVIDSGTYEELISRNGIFRRMATQT